MILLANLFCQGMADAAERRLLATGDGDNVWLARLIADEQGENPRTEIDGRLGARSSWRLVTQIAAHAHDLSIDGGDFLLLLENGDWMLGGGLGRPLPADGKMIALAGGSRGIWAIGLVPGGMKALSRLPTTTTTTQTSRPATMPASAPSIEPSEPVLFLLDKSTWIAQSALPEELALSLQDGQPSMLAGDHGVTLAVVRKDGQIATAIYAQRSGWNLEPLIQAEGGLAEATLLNFNGHVTLWATPVKGVGGFYRLIDGKWGSPVQLTGGKAPGDISIRAVAVASERLRVYYVHEKQLFEQQFDESGKAAGEAAVIDLRQPDLRSMRILNLVMMVALTLVVIGSMRRRNVALPADLESRAARIAPMSLRLSAGLVDALPYLIGGVLAVVASDDPVSRPFDRVMLPYWIGLIVYTLHPLITEMLFGRSVGKMIFGLRVEGIDGKPPTRGALAMRNLIRIVEVLTLFPLVLVFYSPLRQRLGDVVARTLVTCPANSSSIDTQA
ncbi:MAG: RDD family protein [Phycisphaerales bacterium]|nr:RDD family protein [Phycisphaerales bacterium]